MVVDFGYPTFLGWGSLFHLGTASFVVISMTSFAKSLQRWAADSLAFYFKIILEFTHTFLVWVKFNRTEVAKCFP